MKVKKQISAAFFLIALICQALVARAQDDADVRRELEGQYKKLAEAHDRKDLKAIIALKTSDFHAVFPDGRVGDSKLMEAETVADDTMGKDILSSSGCRFIKVY